MCGRACHCIHLAHLHEWDFSIPPLPDFLITWSLAGVNNKRNMNMANRLLDSFSCPDFRPDKCELQIVLHQRTNVSDYSVSATCICQMKSWKFNIKFISHATTRFFEYFVKIDDFHPSLTARLTHRHRRKLEFLCLTKHNYQSTISIWCIYLYNI